MRIDSYGFGRIRIDDVLFTEDVIILGGVVRSPWWRRTGGHVYAPDDLEEVVAAAPKWVLLGTGYFGLARVPDATLRALRTAGSRVVCDRTTPIVERFNRLSEEGREVAAALHLTC